MYPDDTNKSVPRQVRTKCRVLSYNTSNPRRINITNNFKIPPETRKRQQLSLLFLVSETISVIPIRIIQFVIPPKNFLSFRLNLERFDSENPSEPRSSGGSSEISSRYFSPANALPGKCSEKSSGALSRRDEWMERAKCVPGGSLRFCEG